MPKFQYDCWNLLWWSKSNCNLFNEQSNLHVSWLCTFDRLFFAVYRNTHVRASSRIFWIGCDHQKVLCTLNVWKEQWIVHESYFHSFFLSTHRYTRSMLCIGRRLCLILFPGIKTWTTPPLLGNKSVPESACTCLSTRRLETIWRSAFSDKLRIFRRLFFAVYTNTHIRAFGIHTYTRTCINIYIYTNTHVLACINIHTNTHILAYIYIYMFT